MQYRRLGRTDLKVSAICLGTMTFGEQNSEAEGHAQMDRARDAGVNFLDAAELYPIAPKAETQGRTEEIVGTWLTSRGRRAETIVATKVVGRTAMTWFRKDGATGRLDRRQIMEAVEGSLRRLKTDYIDLYQLHWPDRNVTGFGSNPTIWRTPEPAADEVPVEETLAALGELVTSGKVRHVGLSNESPWGTMRFLAAAERLGLPRIVSIQNAYSLVNRTFETGLAEIALREDVSLLAYSPLAQGFLTGKYLGDARPAGARRTLFNRQQRYEGPHAEEAIAAYVALAGEVGFDPAVMAIAFSLTRPFTTSTIIGATTMEQLETDLAAAEVAISPELEARIDAIHRRAMNPCP